MDEVWKYTRHMSLHCSIGCFSSRCIAQDMSTIGLKAEDTPWRDHYQYGGLKKKCILRLAKAKLKMEKKMTLPILHTPLCCSASNQHKAQLTTIKKDGGRVLKKGMHFLFLEWTSPSKHCMTDTSFRLFIPLLLAYLQNVWLKIGIFFPHGFEWLAAKSLADWKCNKQHACLPFILYHILLCFTCNLTAAVD